MNSFLKPRINNLFFIFDIDNFKQANDQFGHAFGDACIKEFTRIIKTSFRETDLLGKLGGDEFAAFIPVSSEDWVEEKATELSQSLHTVYSGRYKQLGNVRQYRYCSHLHKHPFV